MTLRPREYSESNLHFEIGSTNKRYDTHKTLGKRVDSPALVNRRKTAEILIPSETTIQWLGGRGGKWQISDWYGVFSLASSGTLLTSGLPSLLRAVFLLRMNTMERLLGILCNFLPRHSLVHNTPCLLVL